MQCPHCQKPLLAGSKACPYCGKSFLTITPPPIQTPTQVFRPAVKPLISASPKHVIIGFVAMTVVLAILVIYRATHDRPADAAQNLQSYIDATPGPVAPTQTTEPAIAQLRIGMSESQVQSLLGEPTDKTDHTDFKEWSYGVELDDPCQSIANPSICAPGSFMVQFRGGAVFSAFRLDKSLEPPSLDISPNWWR